MPPKQKQVKKGPTYKPAVAAKDIVPPELKEPPREPKSLKLPETFPEPPKNNEPLPPVFEQWPSDEALRTHDFGIASQQRFSDSFHEQIAEYVRREGEAEWRTSVELEVEEEQGEEQGEEETNANLSKNEIESFKHISNQKIEEKAHGAACIIETFLRPENEEEKEVRLKEEAERAEKAAKEKKKAAKKEQLKEEGPVMVSDVKMSDVITRSHMPLTAVWIGSQLQLIKQRALTDVNTGEPVWRKIYPQENGVPQLTKSGKYWVKLLYMGRYVKVEVDDRIPVSADGRALLPRSAHPNEKWTLILSKALIKYLAKVGSDGVVGSGLVAYALTGMVSENIALGHFKEWQKLQEMLNNHHYQRKDLVVSCFSDDPNKNYRKSTQVRVQRQGIEEEDQQLEEREVDTKIIKGYAYCVGDYFDNENFNMVFSQEKTQKQMLLKHQYNELCKVSISNKSREEKLEYRRKKKELKEKLGVEEKKRLQLIAKPAVRHHFLKLLAALRVGCEYGEKEILLAKKCVLNKLNQPPNYDIPMEREEKDSKSIQSLSVSVIKYKEENELFPNLHDFSAIPGVLELLQRPDQGRWISEEDFLQFFETVQVLYNPTAFSHKRIEAVESRKAGSFTHQQGKEILVVEKGQHEEDKKVRLLFGLAYQRSPRDIFSPYSILQKFDFSSFRATSNVVTLSSQLSSRVIELPNQNSVFKLYTMSRGNYNYWLSCDSPFKLMSISDYLTDFEGYTKKALTFEYPPVQAKTYFPLARMRLKQENGNNTVLIKPTGIKEELLGCLNYRLVKVPKDGPMSEQEVEGVVTRKGQQILLAYEYSRFQVEQGEYFLIVEAQAEENIADGTLQLQLLTQNEGLVIQSAEQVQPVKFIEKYLPNKYGTLCKERIFTNSDNNATLTVRIAEFQEQQAAGGGKGAKKGGKEEAATELVERPFNGERRIILKILSGESLLYEAVGVNEITVPNFKFLSTKGTGREYSLLVQFDLRTWPEAVIKNELTEKICWVAQVMAQESLALVRDTKQEDKEKQTRKSWEDAEPGRAERAKKTRRRFLIELKKERGQALTQEEEQILAAPKLTKKQLLQEQRKNEENKKGKGGKKDDKKAGKDAKKEEVIEEKPVEREPPKSKDNFMGEVKEYLRILQNCVVKYEPLEEGESRIRSQEELKAIKEGTRLSTEDRVAKLIRNVEKRETMKLKEKEKREAVAIFASESRSQFKEKYSAYVQWRNQDAEKDKTRQDKERFLVDIISQQKPTISENQLKKHINEYKQINGHNPYLVDVADMARKNIRIATLSDRIALLLPAWEIEQLKTIAEEIKNDGIDGIQPQLHRQFRQLLQQAQRNPGIVAQKQAQAKKAKKGGKK